MAQVLPPSEVSAFARWLVSFEACLTELVSAVVDPPRPPVAPASDATPSSESEDEGAPDWGRWLAARVRPQLDAIARDLGAARLDFEANDPVRRARVDLDRAVASLPEAVSVWDGNEPASDGSRTCLELPFRRFVELSFIPAAHTAIAELHEDVLAFLVDAQHRLTEVEKVVDYYTLVVQRHAAASGSPAEVEDFAQTGLSRIEALVRDLYDARRRRMRRMLDRFRASTVPAWEETSAPYRGQRPQGFAVRLKQLERAAKKPRQPSWTRGLWARGLRAYGATAPAARRFASDVQALIDGPDPREQGSLEGALVVLDEDAEGRALSPSYRRLFTSLPIQIADLYVERPRVEAPYAAAVARWQAGSPISLLVHGDRGSGRRTTTHHVLAGLRHEAEVRWVRLGPVARDEMSVAQALGRALEIEGDLLGFGSLTRARATGPRQVVVIEDAERLLAPRDHAIRRMYRFLELVGETAPNTLWVLIMGTPAFQVLQRLELERRLSVILEVPPMTPAEERQMLLERHHRSGFELAFAFVYSGLAGRAKAEVVGRFTREASSDSFFARLSRLSGGNPGKALQLWLASARPDALRDGRILITSLADAPPSFVGPLPFAQRVLLALLAQYGSLTTAELQEAVLARPDEVLADLRALWVRGYLTHEPVGIGSWSLRSAMVHPLLSELRSTNLI